MLKIATGSILPDGTEQRGRVVPFRSLEAFCTALNAGCAPSTGKQKHGPYWSPFDAPRMKGAKPDWQLLVLDYDDSLPPFGMFDGYEHIRYQTPSSTPEAQRYRIIVTLSEPIPFEHIDSVRRAFPGSDPAAVKPTQIFWHRHPGFLAEFYPGAPLNWRAVQVSAPSTNNEQPRNVDATMSKQALTDALYALDPDSSYDDWIRIGQALHHEYGGSEDGFKEWLHWSERGAKFKGVHDLHSHWRSFTAGGGITGLSLLQMQSAKVDDFPIVTAEQAAPKGLKFIPLRELAQPVPPPYLVDKLIEQGSLIGLIGQRKGGKTYVAFDLAFAVAQGRTWAGAKVISPGPVLWVAAEGARSLATRRAPQWLAHYGDADISVFPRAINMRNVEHVKALIEAAKGAKLVIIDSLRRVTPGAKENQSDELSVALANAEHVALETGATVCVIAHAGKADATSARGSSAIEDSIEIAFAVEKEKGLYRLSMPFARDEDSDDAPRYFGLRRIEPIGLVPGVVVDWSVVPTAEGAEVKGHLKTKVWKAVQSMNGKLRAEIIADICQTYDVRNSNVNRALNDLIEDGLVKIVDGKVSVVGTDPRTDFEILLGVADGD